MLRRKRASDPLDPNGITDYRLKYLFSLVITELLFLGLFELWPNTAIKRKVFTITAEQAPLTISDIRITRQDNIPPAPGPPSDHVVMPTDKIIPVNLSELNDPNLIKPNALPSDSGGGGEGKSEGGIYAHPENPPSVVKIVEPAVPPQAQRAGIKVELRVQFLVGKDGSVKNVSILSIKQYSSNMKSYKMVQSIGYGIIGATLRAASQWYFKPAIDHGKKVRAYSTHIFTFGL